MTHRTHAIILSCIFIFILVAYFFFFTSLGLETIVKLSLAKYAKFREIKIEKIEGNIFLGIRIEALQINKLKRIPQDIVIKIQQVNLNLSGFNFRDIDLKIKNGRVEIAKAQPVIFTGVYNKGKLNFNIYAKSIDIKSYLWLFSDSVILKNATSGEIIEPDFYLKGSLEEAELSGKMFLKMVSFEKYRLSDCPVYLKGVIYSKDKISQVKGDITVESGIINLGGSIIKKVKGMIIFTGDPYNPAFNLEGDSVVGGTRIHAAYKGNYLKPQLRLTSDPILPEEDLIIMLFTGNIFKAESKNLGAEFKVTDKVSVEGQTQLKKQQKQNTETIQKNNDKILLKYKNKF